MIRYVVSFPGSLARDAMLEVRDQLAVAATSRQWRDLVLTHGGTLTRLNERRQPSVAIRNAIKAQVR
jgi:hypothetical protein